MPNYSHHHVDDLNEDVFDDHLNNSSSDIKLRRNRKSDFERGGIGGNALLS